MRANYAVASVGFALVLSACGVPGASAPASETPSATASASATPAAPDCGGRDTTATGDVVLLYFPCGAEGEVYPVERTVAQQGDERLIEVLRLYLAGPSAREREEGFSSLLSPGDIDIVATSPGRVVFDFPSEINNVSTSAGSRAVLDGLRKTLIGLNAIDEIELRLRNDCAAFFEWIQVGPTCHVLMTEGLAPGPSPSPAALVPIIPTSPTGPEITTGSPVIDEHDDGTFRLAPEASQGRYRAGQVIEVAATLTYRGPDATTEARGPGTGLIGFGVESDDPSIRIGPAFTTDCAPWHLTRDEGADYPFVKSGGHGEDEPLAPFYRSDVDTPELRLPAGTWAIFAGGSFYSGDGCGEAFPLHELTASVTVIVEP